MRQSAASIASFGWKIQYSFVRPRRDRRACAIGLRKSLVSPESVIELSGLSEAQVGGAIADNQLAITASMW